MRSGARRNGLILIGASALILILAGCVPVAPPPPPPAPTLHTMHFAARDGSNQCMALTAPGDQQWIVPAGVTQVTFSVEAGTGGAGGGTDAAAGGDGGRVTATVGGLTPGQTIDIFVGCLGNSATATGPGACWSGLGAGYGPGGASAVSTTGAGGGGGLSFVVINSDLEIAAGGGGGGGSGSSGTIAKGGPGGGDATLVDAGHDGSVSGSGGQDGANNGTGGTGSSPAFNGGDHSASQGGIGAADTADPNCAITRVGAGGWRRSGMVRRRRRWQRLLRRQRHRGRRGRWLEPCRPSAPNPITNVTLEAGIPSPNGDGYVDVSWYTTP